MVTDPAAQTVIFSQSWRLEVTSRCRTASSRGGWEGEPVRASPGSGGLLAPLALPGLWLHRPVSACIGIGCLPQVLNSNLLVCVCLSLLLLQGYQTLDLGLMSASVATSTLTLSDICKTLFPNQAASTHTSAGM